MSDITLAELAEDIADTREAIRRVLVSQAQGGPGGRSVTRANLRELREHLAALRAEYRLRSGSGGLPAINIAVRRRP